MQGKLRGESTRFPPMLGSIPTRCHIWVKFLVGSRLAPRAGVLGAS